MKKFTFAEDVTQIDPKLEFREKKIEKEIIGLQKYYKEERLIDQDFIDFTITNKDFHYTDFLFNKFGLSIVSQKLLKIISNHITCLHDIYIVSLFDEKDNTVDNCPRYYLIHIREHKPIIDTVNSLISRTSDRIHQGFLIKPKFYPQASNECFVRDSTYQFAIYVNEKFVDECKRQNISGFDIL